MSSWELGSFAKNLATGTLIVDFIKKVLNWKLIQFKLKRNNNYNDGRTQNNKGNDSYRNDDNKLQTWMMPTEETWTSKPWQNR